MHTLHETVLSHARTRPDAPAVVWDGGLLTYHDLDRLSDELRERLEAAGVGEHHLVPVTTGKHWTSLVAYLAVLRTGAAYVPVDPGWPAARKEAVLSQMAGPVVIAPAPSGEVLLVPASSGTVTGRKMLAAGAATVFFTSGSTGTPKGAVQSHASLLAAFGSEQPFPVDEQTVTATVSALPWDMHAWEVWTPLLAGGCCHVIDGHIDMPSLARLKNLGVNTWFFATSLFNFIVDQTPQLLKGSRVVGFGGEAASAEHLRRAWPYCQNPAVSLVNIYGPVEFLLPTFEVLDRAPDGSTVSIGRPRETVSIQVDGSMDADPDVGELVLSGTGLGLGYLSDGDWWTGGFRRESGVDVYRTGDLVRQRLDGRLEYVSRVDRQIKVGGLRVDLAEVEHALTQTPGVRDAAVILHARPEGPAILVGFYTGEPVADEDLRRECSRHLLASHVPARFRHLDAFPATSTGKIDRNALAGFADAGGAQQRLLGIADRLTGRGPNAGDSPSAVLTSSLLVMQFCAAAGEAGWSITPVEVYAAKSFGELEIEAHTPVDGESSHADGGISSPEFEIYMATAVQEHSDEHVAVSWTLGEGRLDRVALDGAWRAVLHRHARLAVTFALGETGLCAVPGPPPPVVAVKLEKPAEDWLAQLREPVPDLDEGPLVRLYHAHCGEGWILAVAAHHIVVDGLTLSLLWQDLAAAYESLRTGSGVPSRMSQPDRRYEAFAASYPPVERDSPESFASLDDDAVGPLWTVPVGIDGELMEDVLRRISSQGIAPAAAVLAAWQPCAATLHPGRPVGLVVAGRPVAMLDVAGQFASVALIEADESLRALGLKVAEAMARPAIGGAQAGSVIAIQDGVDQIIVGGQQRTVHVLPATKSSFRLTLEIDRPGSVAAGSAAVARIAFRTDLFDAEQIATAAADFSRRMSAFAEFLELGL